MKKIVFEQNNLLNSREAMTTSRVEIKINSISTFFFINILVVE